VSVLFGLINDFGITWNPGLRGILVVATGVVVLVGSIYAILATNLGGRLGFLVTVAGLAGWMAMMGFVWALYGIGYKGEQAHWVTEEVVTSDSVEDLSAAKLEKAHDLSKWEELPDGSQERADAASAAAAALTTEGSAVELFDTEQDYLVVDAYSVGGKGDSLWERRVPGPHPPRYAIVQVQSTKKVSVPFGETPPPREVDESAPVVSVVMVRDLGSLRLPSMLIGIGSTIIFGVACHSLHRRDKAVMAARAAAAV
jgi:hypothetical protein